MAPSDRAFRPVWHASTRQFGIKASPAIRRGPEGRPTGRQPPFSRWTPNPLCIRGMRTLHGRVIVVKAAHPSPSTHVEGAWAAQSCFSRASTRTARQSRRRQRGGAQPLCRSAEATGHGAADAASTRKTFWAMSVRNRDRVDILPSSSRAGTSRCFLRSLSRHKAGAAAIARLGERRAAASSREISSFARSRSAAPGDIRERLRP